MSDDLVSLKIAILSEVASERELVRQAAAQGSVPIDFTEIDTAGDLKTKAELIASGRYDVVFFVSRLAKPARQDLLAAIRAAPSRPLAVLIGAAEMKTREVLTDGLEVDSALAKPIDVQETSKLIDHCVRARLPKQVLIVDDSSTVRSVIRKVLQASRYTLQAEEAENGSVAIDLVKKQRYDIVFMDCQMPVVDGFAALEKFKHTHPDMQVVMITGTRDVRIEDRARAAGAKDFLYKPFFAKDIDAVLSRLLGLMRPRWN